MRTGILISFLLLLLILVVVFGVVALNNSNINTTGNSNTTTLIPTMAQISNSDNNLQGSNIPSSTTTISIENFSFTPNVITIPVGTTITWVNNDTVAHLIASDPNPTHTDLPDLISSTLNPGESYSYTFTKVGSWGYHCQIHPEMQGSVIVTG